MELFIGQVISLPISKLFKLSKNFSFGEYFYLDARALFTTLDFPHEYAH
jgi:hypothetical protein